jgi:hypothetical protein
MHIVSDVVRNIITLDDAFIALYILTAIVAAQATILVNLAERVGGVRKLIKLASSPLKDKVNDASDKKTDA